MKRWLPILGGAGLLAAAALLTLAELRGADIENRLRSAGADVEFSLRNQVLSMADEIRAIARQWGEAFPEGKAAETARILDADIVAYEAPPPKGQPRCVAWCRPDREAGPIDDLPLHLRLPAALLLPPAPSELPRPLAWFTADGESLYVNCLRPAHRALGPDHLRLVHLSMPLHRPDELRLQVRCDVIDGRLAPTLPPAGPDTEGETLLLAWPHRQSWTFPLSTDRRARMRLGGLVAERPAGWLLALWAAGAGLFLLGLWTLRGHPTRTADEGLEAAHELRTPLTVLRGEIELALRRERDSEAYRAALRTALAEVEGMQGLVDSMLALGTAPEPQRLTAIPMAELVLEAVAEAQSAHPERSIQIEVEGSGPCRGDATMLHRAVANLIENACLHSVPGGEVRIAVTRRGRSIEVSVEDDGPGIPIARHEKVFERFYRGPQPSPQRVRGAGLGLAVVRWVAERHGGSATLDAELEERARFVLTLPACDSPGD